jgi:hypothetical protein
MYLLDDTINTWQKLPSTVDLLTEVLSALAAKVGES